jgi:hypothetical protein
MPSVPGRKRDDGIYVANTSFICDLDGVQETIHKGSTRVRGGHPLLRAHPEYFDRADVGVQFEVVEQATAAPGEKRGAPIA